MKTETYNTRGEWLEARKRGLGGTDIAAILGDGGADAGVEELADLGNDVIITLVAA